MLYFITFYICHTGEKNSVLQVFSTHLQICPLRKLWKSPLQGVAEAELEADLERTFKILFFSSAEEVSRDKLHKSATWHSWPTVYAFYLDLSFLRRSALTSAQQESALEVRRVKCRCSKTFLRMLKSNWWLCCIEGGLFVGLPKEVPLGTMVTEDDLKFYVSQYKERGFRSQDQDIFWKTAICFTSVGQ